MARRPTIKALTGLINARARAAEADNARARTELDTLRLADTIAQRDRFTAVLNRDREQRQMQVFEYRRLLQPPPYTDADVHDERNW